MKLTTKLTALLLFILFFSACSNNNDDDEPTPPTPACTTLTTSAIVNGDDSYTLQLAQLLVTGESGAMDYIFQVGAVKADCIESTIFSISLEVSGDIDGTYPVVDFFSAGINEASGSFATQSLATASQTIIDIQSGSVTITDNGNSNYSIDFEGTLVNGNDASFATTHTF